MIFAQTLNSAPVRLPKRVDYWRHMSVLAALLVSASLQADDRVEINYGWITEHYQTRWSDPTLPAGVARGMPPSPQAPPMKRVSDDEGESSKSADSTDDANVTDTTNDTNEAAVLFAIDLGEDGMTMVVSTKTSLRPGDCAAVERSGAYFNLRGVNPGFCDPTNQATIAALQSVTVAAAQRCKVARAQLAARTFEGNQTPTRSEVGMLCDGS